MLESFEPLDTQHESLDLVISFFGSMLTWRGVYLTKSRFGPVFLQAGLLKK